MVRKLKRFLKKCLGKFLRSLLIPFIEVLSFPLLIYKYADQKAMNRKAILDRLADRGGSRKV
jgi:hypothetical protein